MATKTSAKTSPDKKTFAKKSSSGKKSASTTKKASTKKSRKPKTTRKYGKESQSEVKKEMHRFKRGTAHSGPKLKPVKSRKQAIAIALSKARKKGAKVPKKAKS